MCNLYSLNKKRDMVARFFRVSHNRTAALSRPERSSLVTLRQSSAVATMASVRLSR
jgi:hypothetical protein